MAVIWMMMMAISSIYFQRTWTASCSQQIFSLQTVWVVKEAVYGQQM